MRFSNKEKFKKQQKASEITEDDYKNVEKDIQKLTDDFTKEIDKIMSNKEKEQTQKHIVALSGLIFISGFILCGLDHRYAWSHIPLWVSISASVVFIIGYILYAEVLRENAYLSRTIEVQDNQLLIDTGLYAIVRHPMYTATLLMFLSMPIILGSWWALIIFAVYPILITARIQNEEKVLATGLKGYTYYQKRVRWRLIPWVW